MVRVHTKCHGLEFEQIDFAIILPLANQLVASESERAHDQCQSVVVTSPVNLSFSFMSGVSSTLFHTVANKQ